MGKRGAAQHTRATPSRRHPLKEIFLLLFLFGCGRKLPPQAPLLVLPARVEPVRISQEGADVVLRFPFPTLTNGGETLTNLTKVTVLREIQGAREGQKPPATPADAASRERDEKLFRQRAEPVAELTRAELDAATSGADLVVRDPLVPLYREKRVGRVLLRYGVTATRDKKRVSELSPIAAIVPRVPPGRPLRLVATVEETRVCLDWWPPAAMLDGETPATVAGYAVYRRELADEEYDAQPLGVAIGPLSYVDETARTGHRYVYTVRAAPVAEVPLILGPAADEVLASTQDVFPPRAPEGLLVLVEAGGTRLVWNPSLAGDLAFYRVYVVDGGKRMLLKDEIKDPLWFDAGASGRTYGVTAVDTSGNESPMGTAK